MHSVLLESLLAEAKDLSKLSVKQIVQEIDKRSPDEEFSIEDIFSKDELDQLKANPNIAELEAESEVLFQAIMGEDFDSNKKNNYKDDDDDDDDDDDSLDDTLDPDDEDPKVEAENSRGSMERKYNEFFANYRRAKDVSSKIKSDANYDIKALFKRRVKDIPVDVPFGMSDVFSAKEINAIMLHPNYKMLDRHIRDSFTDTLEEQAGAISDSIDSVLIDAFLSEDKVLARGLPAEAVYRAGMATHSDGQFRLSELGERHAKDLLNALMSGEELVVFEDGLVEDTEGAKNTPEMDAELKAIPKGTKISIRPNLNSRSKETLTVHKGSVGKKLADVRVCTIKCTGTVVQDSGRKKVAQGGHKNVHAGLAGTIHDEVIMPKAGDPLVKYNPRKDTFFHINGKKYEGGGLVTMVGWKAFKVK